MKIKKLKINYLEELSGVLEDNDLEKKDICIVGSAVMALHNLRDNDDIDIVVKKTIRNERFPPGATKLSQNIELVAANWVFYDENITDDNIIDNEQHHTTYDGYKFVNLSLLEVRKKSANKQKDLKDTLIIEAYNAG